jgi:hypothetical protein
MTHDELWMNYVRPRFKEIYVWKHQDYLTNTEIARNLGLTLRQFNMVLKHNKTLKDILDEADEYILKNVEISLFKEATGYEYEEKHIELYPSGEFDVNGQPIMLQRHKIIKKWARPSHSAQIFILTNIKPDKYKRLDKTEIFNIAPVNIIDDIGV